MLAKFYEALSDNNARLAIEFTKDPNDIDEAVRLCCALQGNTKIPEDQMMEQNMAEQEMLRQVMIWNIAMTKTVKLILSCQICAVDE